jgi:hypothetical protein
MVQIYEPKGVEVLDVGALLAQLEDGVPQSDYILKEGERSCWIQVNNIAVHIARTDEGVSVDLYPAGSEMNDSLAGTWLLFQEAVLEEDESPIGWETLQDGGFVGLVGESNNEEGGSGQHS